MKIEFDLPNFEKELKIDIVIRKDGEVVYSASSSTPDDYNEVFPNSLGSNGDEKPKKKKTTKKVNPGEDSPGLTGGNFMNMNF